MRDQRRAGHSYEEARAAILGTQEPAGEWARRVDERQLQRAWEANAAPDPNAVALSTATPLNSANEFVRYTFNGEGTSRLIFYRGEFYQWVGSHFEECDDAHMRSRVYEFLNRAVTQKGGKFVPFNPTMGKVNATLDALESLVEENSKFDAPFWLDHDPAHPDPSQLLACRNGLLNVETRELQPHTPRLFNVNALTFDYDAKAPTYPKQWLKFLRELFPDKQARFTLQEIFGLLLTPNTRYQKIFLVVGPKRSGKGTIARVLTALLGKENCAAPTLSGLTTNFGMSSLIDKRVAIIADARLGSRTDARTVAERLLSISGEDAQNIDRKYQTIWIGQLRVRFVVLTNELPRIADASGALTSRFIVLTLTRSFYDQEDLALTDKLQAELPCILNWALRGLVRLRERGHFKMPKASLVAIRQLEDLASPISAFVREWCVVEHDASVRTRWLYEAWRCWTEQNGQKPSAYHVFGRDLHAALPQVRVKGKGNDRAYIGIRLSESGQAEFERAVHTSPNRRTGFLDD
jgi:putative DNA primase/helicase